MIRRLDECVEVTDRIAVVTGIVAFDTTATAGTLTMADAAGNAVITWSIRATGPVVTGTAARSVPTRTSG